MKGKITAVLFILVFLLVVAVVFTFLTSLDRRNEEAQQPVSTDVHVTENTPAPTAEPGTPASAVPYQAPTPTPVPTPAPTPEAAVIETPAPSTVPMAAPDSTQAIGTLLASGSFASHTGAAINIRADWEARVAGAQEISVTVNVTLNSYSIYVGELASALNIGLNGQYVSLGTPAISYDSNTTQLSTPLGSQSFTVQLPEGNSRDLGLQVEWHWGGVYGGMEIPVIECGGNFTVAR